MGNPKGYPVWSRVNAQGDCPCGRCGYLMYRTARKPWRHFRNHSTYCADHNGVIQGATVTEPLSTTTPIPLPIDGE